MNSIYDIREGIGSNSTVSNDLRDFIRDKVEFVMIGAKQYLVDSISFKDLCVDVTGLKEYTYHLAIAKVILADHKGNMYSLKKQNSRMVSATSVMPIRELEKGNTYVFVVVNTNNALVIKSVLYDVTNKKLLSYPEWLRKTI